MVNADLDQPVVVTVREAHRIEPLRFDTLRKALHSIIVDFEPELLPSAFICMKQGGLNIVEIRAMYGALCKAYAENANKGITRPFPIDA